MNDTPTDPAVAATVFTSLWQNNLWAVKVSRWLAYLRANGQRGLHDRELLMAKPPRTPPDAGLGLIDRYAAALIQSRMDRLHGSGMDAADMERERAAVMAMAATIAERLRADYARGHSHERSSVAIFDPRAFQAAHQRLKSAPATLFHADLEQLEIFSPDLGRQAMAQRVKALHPAPAPVPRQAPAARLDVDAIADTLITIIAANITPVVAQIHAQEQRIAELEARRGEVLRRPQRGQVLSGRLADDAQRRVVRTRRRIRRTPGRRWQRVGAHREARASMMSAPTTHERWRLP